MSKFSSKQLYSSDIYELFYKYQELSINEIRSLLTEKNESFSEEDLLGVLYDIYCKRGMLVRTDYWEKDSTFKMVDSYYYDSAYSKHFYRFIDNGTKDKEFILISDTHIGNPDLENYHLLDNIYAYAAANNIQRVFHLGDIFAGKYANSFSANELDQQISLFKEMYPNTYSDGILTFANLGNHDEWINGFLNLNKTIKNPLNKIFDLRRLGEINESFNLIPRDRFYIKFSNKKFHFSHRLFYSVIIPDMYLSSISDIERQDGVFSDDDYDVLFSGHLHQGMIYTTDQNRLGVDKIYLGVPSLSQLNINKIIAYKISLNYKEDELDNMEVTLLRDSEMKKVVEDETIEWNFKYKNKCYRKIF